MQETPKHGRIAFITTPDYRTKRRDRAEQFVYRHMYSLCHYFKVLMTGRTHDDLLVPLAEKSLEDIKPEHCKVIAQDMRIQRLSRSHLDQWRTTVLAGSERTMAGYPGMIYVAYELVEGRLDALIHLTDWVDKSAKPDSAVLSREANVHNVPTATDIETATAFIESWQAKIAQASQHPKIFRLRQEPENPPLRGLEKSDRVIAMVAHNNMKLDICCFAVEHAPILFERYRYILATGTTGAWLKKFMLAAKRGRDDLRRIRLCNSGPEGGDLQIAYAVVKGWCQEIIFLQDPSVSHPHDSDIKLFEQAVLSEKVKVIMATNLDSARLLVGA